MSKRSERANLRGMMTAIRRENRMRVENLRVKIPRDLKIVGLVALVEWPDAEWGTALYAMDDRFTRADIAERIRRTLPRATARQR